MIMRPHHSMVSHLSALIHQLLFASVVNHCRHRGQLWHAFAMVSPGFALLSSASMKRTMAVQHFFACLRCAAAFGKFKQNRGWHFGHSSEWHCVVCRCSFVPSLCKPICLFFLTEAQHFCTVPLPLSLFSSHMRLRMWSGWPTVQCRQILKITISPLFF